MRAVVCGLAAGLLACHAADVQAQQGVVQVSGASQIVSGGTVQTGDNTVEPDFGVSWIQPGVRFGSFQLELRGSKRGDLMHVGRTYVALRELNRGGLTWSFEAGDAYFTRALGDYGFTNLTTPAVTLNGGTITARHRRGGFQIIGGNGTAWRNIFGTDPDTLKQTLGLVRGSYKVSDRLEVLSGLSRIQTSDLREFSFSMVDSKQAGIGVRMMVLPSIQLTADGSYLQYRRLDSPIHKADGSYLTGASFLLPRGWIQVNAARFSPGDFPALNDPMHDRESVFGAGEYDLWSRATVFGGWETVTTNIDPDPDVPSSANLPRNTATRGFGGVRVRLNTQSNVTFRIEEGDRIARPPSTGLASESDTGLRSAEWQGRFGSMTSYARVARRQNLDRRGAEGSYTQDDLAGQLFFRVSRSTQLFGSAGLTRHETGLSLGSTYSQVGGGTEIQLAQRNIFARGEFTASRNVDLVTREFVPREMLNVGINGQIRSGTFFALNVAAYRAPVFSATSSQWTTRSMMRITQNFSTGTARIVTSGLASNAAARSRGTGQIVGTVYADWNGNGLQDPDENVLENIPVRVSALSTTTTRRDGQFSFLNVPVGPQQVGLDTAAVPVDFDPPPVSLVDLELERNGTRRVTFGLLPLGSVRGRVIRDANANGKVDPGEEAIDGAVLVLDGGKRSEQARRGVYRFDSIRSGNHTVSLLADSLPEGAVITGTAEVPVDLTRAQLVAELDFLVTITKRPETRRVFPPRGGGAPPPAARPKPPGDAAAPPRAPVPPTAAPSGRGNAGNGTGTGNRDLPAPRPRPAEPRPSDAPRFAVQIAALNDPLRARLMVHDLSLAGFPAYVVSPGTSDPDGPYRVRVGGFSSREAASKAAATLQKLRGEKLWVINEPPTQ